MSKITVTIEVDIMENDEIVTRPTSDQIKNTLKSKDRTELGELVLNALDTVSMWYD